MDTTVLSPSAPISSRMSTLSPGVAAPIAMVNSSRLCPHNCYWHGYCESGRCVCEALWTGGSCTKANDSYLMVFSAVFCALTVVSFVQLILAIYHDIKHDSKHKLRDAFRFSTQKWLIFVVWLASGSRAFYFTMQKFLPVFWATSVESIYYPFVITGCSMLVCFWAERYYLEIPSDCARSISKSLLAYVGFNILLYLVVAIMIAVSFTAPTEDQLYLHSIFNGVFAFLMLFVLIFFLIFGVELFFKVKGAFKSAGSRVNGTQLSLSRVGLVFQATFQLVIVLLLLTDVSSRLYQHRLPYLSRTAFDIICRVLELAVAIWFPCCLWNLKDPSSLWILNPRRLLRVVGADETTALCTENQVNYRSTATRSNVEHQLECWICYDKAGTASGPLICPCNCKGDVAAVHHNCLRRWLVEQGDFPSNKPPCCNVCKKEYVLISQNSISLRETCDWRHALRTSLLVSIAVGLPVLAIALWQTHHLSGYLSAAIIIVTVFSELICLRLLGVTIEKVWHRAVLTAMTIAGREPPASSSSDTNDSTPSST